MAHLAQIWRYPIKSIGRERLREVDLSAGKLLPMDRQFAVTHIRTSFDTDFPAWAQKLNFLNGFKLPELQSIETEHKGEMKFAFQHPKMESVTLDLADQNDAQTLIHWLTDLLGDTPWEPRELVELESGLGDQSKPLISINNLSSLQDLSAKSGKALEVERWRGNLWLDDLAPMSELDMIGKTLSIGEAKLEIIKPVDRCNMPMANPQTGEKDFDALGQLRRHYQHVDFGVFARVINDGSITENMEVHIS